MTDVQLVVNEEKINHIHFDMKLSEFYKVWLTYIIKCIFTLGVYCFWGATKVRTYLTNKFSLDGERFSYTGTAKELFFGFLTILMIIELPEIICYLVMITKLSFSINLAAFTEEYMRDSLGNFYFFSYLWAKITTLLFTLVSPYLLIKYRTSRTKWKGITPKLNGTGWSYIWLTILSIMSILSLNIFAPYTDIKRKSYIWNNMHLGNNKFNIDAKSMPLMKVNLLTTLLMLPTFLISRCWYYAALDRYIYSKLEINGIKFNSIVTGPKLVKLWLGNILLLIITLGLATPWAIQRNLKFYVDNHIVIGNLNNLDLSENKLDSINKDYSFYSLFGNMGQLDLF